MGQENRKGENFKERTVRKLGTRNLICVVKNNEYKVAQYGQWDGYPEGQGVEILNFLTQTMNKELFKKKLDEVSFATHEDLMRMWEEAGADPNSEWVSMEISDKFNQLYPENSRNTGALILSIIQGSSKPLKLHNSLNFAADSLFCEWAYVLDLDKNTFEVYEGFNKQPLNENERFFSMT